jgi:phosphatidylglycerol:prolipoprotein diacylglycerol transferase
VVRLAFDPQVDLGALAVRWQAIALVAIFLVALGCWWLSLRRTRPSVSPDDLLFVLLGIVPGALVGGRLVHGIVFMEAYLARPEAILDLSQGSLSLFGAVLGGFISGAYVCRLLGHSVRVWADATAVPLLLAIGLGKSSMVLAGGGQGLPFDGPWALSFNGPGPWLATDPGTAAHPSQLYEGAWALAGAMLLLVSRARRARPGHGWVFLFAVGWWLAGRFLAGFTWRDDAWLAGLSAEQLIALAGSAAALAGSAVVSGFWSAGRPKVPGR